MARHADYPAVPTAVLQRPLPMAFGAKDLFDFGAGKRENSGQQFVGELADRLFRGPTVEPLGSAGPVGDPPFEIAHHSRRQIEHRQDVVRIAILEPRRHCFSLGAKCSYRTTRKARRLKPRPTPKLAQYS